MRQTFVSRGGLASNGAARAGVPMVQWSAYPKAVLCLRSCSDVVTAPRPVLSTVQFARQPA